MGGGGDFLSGLKNFLVELTVQESFLCFINFFLCRKKLLELFSVDFRLQESDLQNQMNPELRRWLKANKLILNVAKTEFMIIGSHKKF